tara:strand:- start:334 stop:759 length:426 start_codon:yes stop_codon:yes gene_type:complete
MKVQLRFLAVPASPDSFEISGEVVTAVVDGEQFVYDLTGFPEGGRLQSADRAGGKKVLWGVDRTSEALLVTLGQTVIAGKYPNRKAHWRESPIIDATDYDPNTCYVIPTGMAGVDDYEVVQGVDVAGNTGWTVRKKEMADG